MRLHIRISTLRGSRTIITQELELQDALAIKETMEYGGAQVHVDYDVASYSVGPKMRGGKLLKFARRASKPEPMRVKRVGR